MRKIVWMTGLCLALSGPVSAACGGSFGSFVNDLKTEALGRGFEKSLTDSFFKGVSLDQGVLKADRRQGVFQLRFTDFARRLISSNRIDAGRKNATKWDSVFDQIERDYGISRGVLLAFWAFETDFGAFQGDFNTRNALVTLSHDCRRPELFRPQIFAALELFSEGDFDPQRTTGAWAGEIGMVQMLPADILENGIDGDGDGHVTLKTSAPDALLSGGKMLQSLGWRAGEPWLQEVTLPNNFELSLTGLPTELKVSEWEAKGVKGRSSALKAGMTGSIILPEGQNGPAFFAYPNFRVFFEWNQSFTYVLTAAYFATRLEGAAVFDAGSPADGLSSENMKLLQRKLVERGHDVGKIDGILGSGTRAAVRVVQKELGLPVDAWPTLDLLNQL